VGHFSVRPDFGHSHRKRAIRYALLLIHQGTEILLAKRQKPGGSDAQAFREKLASECAALGYRIDV